MGQGETNGVATTPPDAGRPSSRSAAAAHRLRSEWPWGVAGIVALIPALRMLRWIRGGTHVQFGDYWPFIAETFTDGGTLKLDGLTRFNGQHLLTVTQLVYAANTWLFGGSNITLGYWVLAVALAQAGFVAWWLRGQVDLPSVVAAAAAACATSLLLAPQGAWNFLRAMSGTAWLTANLLAIVAIHLMVRGRTTWALVAGVTAIATYGTGVVALPAVVVVALWLHRRPRTVVATMATTFVASALYLGLRTRSGPRLGESPDPIELVRNTATVVGAIVSGGVDRAMWVGLGAGLLLATLIGVAVRWRTRAAAPWAALALYAMGNAVILGYGRHQGVAPGGPRSHLLSSRYTSISALVWIGLLGLALTVIPWARARGRVAPALISLGLVAAAVVIPLRGTAEVARTNELSAGWRGLAYAQRVKVSAGGQWFALIRQPDVDEALERLGHHPFDGRFDDGCGRLGTSDAPPDASPVDGLIRAQEERGLDEGVELGGWVDLAASTIDCIVVAGPDGDVTGLGFVRRVRDDRTEVLAYAPAAPAPRTVYLRTHDDTWHAIPVT